VATFACLIAAPSLVYAHGGMGPNEVGPPLVTSGLLGFVSYWMVMLWPSSKKKHDPNMEDGRKGGDTPSTEKRAPRKIIRVKRAPRLRKIEGTGRFLDDQTTRRKASDG
jgi:hypothetical protein